MAEVAEWGQGRASLRLGDEREVAVVTGTSVSLTDCSAPRYDKQQQARASRSFVVLRGWVSALVRSRGRPIRTRLRRLDADNADVVKEHMRSTVSGMTAVCVASLFLAVGCGGGTDTQAGGVGDEFATKALAACEMALKDKQGWQPFPVTDFDPTEPDASKLPEVSTWLSDEVAPTFHAWLSSLQALGTPPSAKADWDTMLAAVEKIDRLNTDQITAANAGDPAAFATATAELGSTQDELVAAAEKAGVAACADVHGT